MNDRYIEELLAVKTQQILAHEVSEFPSGPNNSENGENVKIAKKKAFFFSLSCTGTVKLN